uniref:MFS domain-containing protein n=1 Tax=Angiostrongylus cantonensis TaxID=6313 RepID=A0A0K0DEF5_ANGCA
MSLNVDRKTNSEEGKLGGSKILRFRWSFPHNSDIDPPIQELNPFTLFIMLSTAFLWCLSAMTTMSPAYLSPSTICHNNCTFFTVQKEFKVNRTLIDPSELVSSMYFLGNLVFGQMYCMAADRIGRRPVLVWSLIVSGLAGVGAAIAPNLFLMLSGRFIQGSFFSSITMINWVLCCESIAFKGHSYTSVLYGIFWFCWLSHCGYCLVTPIAAYFPSWRLVQLITSLPTLFFGVVILLPESFGFLVAKKKAVEAEKWMQRAQHWSGRNVEFDILNTIKIETAKISEETNLFESLSEYHDVVVAIINFYKQS